MTRLQTFISTFREKRVSHLLNDADTVSFTSFTNEGNTTKLSSLHEPRHQKTDNIFPTAESVSFYHLIRMLILLLLSFIAMSFLILTLVYMLCHSDSATSARSSSRYYTIKGKTESLPPPPKPDVSVCNLMRVADRFDCFPEDGYNQAACEQRGCCWSPVSAPLGTPYCFYPSNYTSYYYVNVTKTSYGLYSYLKRKFKSAYPGDVDTLLMTVKFETETRLHVKFTDPAHNRFEPPYPVVPVADRAASNLTYVLVIDAWKSGFQVLRKSDNFVIFDSVGIPNTIFSDQFLQYSTRLPSQFIYGLGEHRSNFMLSNDWQSFTLFNHDSIPRENMNLYGSHPFYMAMEPTGNAHGVFLLNSNAMQIILQPTPAITFRPIGGILDFYFFLGPKPSDVVAQYTELIGRPYMPPYWALGFHLCRFGYKTLNQTIEVLERNLKAGIPIDTQWNDLDYMDNSNDFTYDKRAYKGLPEFVKGLHQKGMHYIPLVDPGVSASEKPGTYPPYDQGLAMDIFVKNSTGQPFIGKVWNKGTTVWPDFTHPNTVDYWTLMLKSLHNEIPFDGAWIDMNEPSNFWSGTASGCPSSPLEHPPYTPPIEGGVMYYKTMCMTAKHYAGLHYNVHNLYGLSEAIVTSFALSEIRSARPVVITRASFPGLGHYAGHWSGDVWSAWHDMRMSVPQLLSFSLFGVPLMGADICGFNGNTTEALCNRWMQLGAFYPFSRNHNTDDGSPQDPAAFGGHVVNSTKKAMAVRYALLPYLYTLFWEAHVYGETVARPLFFEFPNDKPTYNADNLFLWGPALLIVPVLTESNTTVYPYLPRGYWYDYYTNAQLTSEGDLYPYPAPNETIPVFVRGGYILPQQKPLSTTTESRKTNLELLVATDESGQASGKLYWDDGDSLNAYEENRYTLLRFSLAFKSLRSEVVAWKGETPPNLGKVTVLGVKERVKSVMVNGKSSGSFTYDTHQQVLSVNVDVDLKTAFVISWE